MKKSLFSAIAVGLCMTANVMAQVPSYVPSSGLVGWWPFNGNANDESGNGNNGTVNGATLTTDRFGNTNKAYSFDGDDLIQCLNSGPTGNPTITSSFWIKKPDNSYGHIIGYGNDGINGQDYRIYVGSGNCSTGSIAFDTYNNAKAIIDNQNNEWDFYVVVYDGIIGTNTSIANIYKNNILISSLCQSINITNTNISNLFPITFGNYHGTIQDGFYTGLLDDIGIWNRALTQQEITDLYNANICYDYVTVTDTLVINTGITGYNPITYMNTLKIWPNPTNDHITIDAGDLTTMNGYSIKIEDAQGQQVFQNAVNQQQFYIDITTWGGNGLYFVRIIDPQGNTVDIKKIVLQ
jgi:hypothetical protein